MVVDGVVGSFKTGSLGGSRAIFCTFGKAKHKLRKHIRELTFDPRGATIVVRDAETAADDASSVSWEATDSANGAFACCTPDDGGVECEVRTPEDCTAGGSAELGNVVLLDPCAVPPVDTVCCVASVQRRRRASRATTTTTGMRPRAQRLRRRSDARRRASPKVAVVVTASSCDPNPCVRGDDDSSHDDSSDDGSHDDGDHNDDDQGGDGDQGSHDGGGGHGHHGGGDD